MPERPIVIARVGAIAPFVTFLGKIGSPCERLLETARLAPDLLTDPGALFPLRQGLRFIDAAAQSQGIQDLGLIVGQRTQVVDLLPLGGLLSPHQTLAEAIALLVRNIRYFNSGQDLSLECRDHLAFFRHCLPSTPDRHAGIFSLMLMIDVIRLAGGPHWHPDAVYLPQSEADRAHAYEAALSVPCRRGKDCWTVVFDEAMLEERLLYCRPGAHSTDEIVAELQCCAPAGEFHSSLRQLIASMLPLGSPALGAVANVGGLSPRTLQRRLSVAGWTYSDVVEDVRREAAMRLLRKRDVKIVNVAYDLGYTDAANFTRAFRRWTGMSPRVFQTTQIQG